MGRTGKPPLVNLAVAAFANGQLLEHFNESIPIPLAFCNVFRRRRKTGFFENPLVIEQAFIIGEWRGSVGSHMFCLFRSCQPR